MIWDNGPGCGCFVANVAVLGVLPSSLGKPSHETRSLWRPAPSAHAHVTATLGQVCLRELRLANNRLKAFVPDRKTWLPCLEYLDLSGNAVSMLGSLNSCVSLNVLLLHDNALSDVKGVVQATVGCVMLSVLRLDNNRIPSLHLRALKEFKPSLVVEESPPAPREQDVDATSPPDHAEAVAERLADNPTVGNVLQHKADFTDVAGDIEEDVLRLCKPEAAADAAQLLMGGCPSSIPRDQVSMVHETNCRVDALTVKDRSGTRPSVVHGT